MKGVTIPLPVQWSAESWELVFKIAKKVSYRSQSCVFRECAYANDQIMIPILIPH